MGMHLQLAVFSECLLLHKGGNTRNSRIKRESYSRGFFLYKKKFTSVINAVGCAMYLFDNRSVQDDLSVSFTNLKTANDIYFSTCSSLMCNRVHTRLYYIL